MLTLFRHIRSSLLENRAFNQYFFYAIGEIALVVIGILIALQINNWNEESAKRKQTHTYLVNLRTAIEEDIYLLQMVQQVNTFRKKSSEYILRIGGHALPWSEPTVYADSNFIWNENFPDTFDREIFNLWLLYSSRARIKTVNTSAIEELKSTGIFSYI